MRTIFVVEALIIGLAGALVGFRARLSALPRARHVRIKNPFLDSDRLPLTYTYVALCYWRGWSRSSHRLPRAISRRARLPASHPVEIIRGAT